MVAQAGAGGGVVEDLDDLGAEAAGELAGAAEGVLPGDAALLVGGGAERQVGLAEQPVVGDDAVPGGADVGQAGAHFPVDGDGAAGAEGGSGAGGQAGVGPDADHDQHQVRQPRHGRAVGSGGVRPGAGRRRRGRPG